MQTPLNMETLLLDDESESLALSKNALLRYIPEKMIHTAAEVEEAMNVLRSCGIQLAFLDVELTRSDGFSFCETVHRAFPDLKVVFLTGHVELGARSYDYEPFDFLVKPVDAQRLERTLRRFEEHRKQSLASRIAIETAEGFMQLNLTDVLYISKTGNNCIVHCADGREHKVSCSLDKLETMLAERGFFRSHQSFLVAADKIRSVKTSKFGSTYEAVLNDDTVIPVSRNKYAMLKEFILRRSVHM